ncbi:MAG: diguanylate cyclase [Methylococcaceae bacterium]
MNQSTPNFDVDQRQRGKNVAMLTLDIKALHEGLNHAKSNEFLKRVEQSMRQRLRDGDSVAKISDGSFIVLIDNIRTLGNAQKVADSLIENLSHLLALTQDSGEEINVKICVDFVPEDDDQPD